MSDLLKEILNSHIYKVKTQFAVEFAINAHLQLNLMQYLKFLISK